MSNLNLTASQLDLILSPTAIRERAGQIFELTKQKKTSFVFHPEKLEPLVEYVLKVIRQNYPDLNIPFHSRWGHFRAGQIDRSVQFEKSLGNIDPLESARAKLDLVITSVLLDAGSGPHWKYFEKSSGKYFDRSEGLGVASFDLFCTGLFSKDRKSLRADQMGLQSLTLAELKEAFQVSETNPLVGVEGRLALLNNLGTAIRNKALFCDLRPGNILDFLLQKYGKTIPATGLLRAVLDGFGPIWPGRLSSNQINLGDVWTHSKLSAQANSFESLVPIHKLSQWMTYSLIEPINQAGLTVSGVEELTGLAEYRNGGLLIDSGLLELANPEDLKKSWHPSSELIIEWRALTIVLLDQIGAKVQTALGKTPADFPLAKVLEGGTWWAGRSLAKELRAGGGPPLNIQSDGTVF